MKVVIVNGYPRVGKDLFVSYCIEEQDCFAQKVSTVDEIKNIAYSCGWSGEKTPESRKFLSELKRILNEWNDFAYQKTCKKIRNFEDYLNSLGINPNKGISFVMCREPEEIARFVKDFGATTVLIRRAEMENLEQSNNSDINVLNYEYDYIIENNGTTEDLKNAAQTFLTNL